MFAQLFAVAVLAVSAQSVVAADCLRSYTIKDGDYCDKISQAQNVSTYQLAVSNTGRYKSDCSNLKIGGTLCLATKPAEDCQTTYTVAPGDTCFGVAAAHALNTTILYLNNPQIDETCSNIYVGEVLCTSKTVQVAAIPAGGVVVQAPGASSTVLSTTPAARFTGTPTAVAVAAATTTAKASPAKTSAVPVTTGGDDDTCDDDDSTTDNNNDDDCDDDSDDNDDDLPFCDEI